MLKSQQEGNSSESEMSVEELQSRPGKKAKTEIDGDEELAKSLQFEFDQEAGHFDSGIDDSKSASNPTSGHVSIQEDSPMLSIGPVAAMTNTTTVPKFPEEKLTQFTSIEQLLRSLGSSVDESDQFFLVVRRGSSFQRQLKIWQRESKKSSPAKLLRVHFAGEDGIDSGAMAKEFLGNAVREMGKVFFPVGVPIDSMLHVHNGFFLACGQIVAVSLVQGGPPPCFLTECAFQMLVSPDIDVNDLKEDIHLTPSEKSLLESIRENPVTHQDTILEHGYTGIVDLEHVNDITGTVMVSLISRRSLFLKEFGKGLELYGLESLVKGNADLCKPLFVKHSYANIVDANYIVSVLKPEYSQEGSSRREIEEAVIDNFQDLLMRFVGLLRNAGLE